ncbi:MAG: glutamate mutase L [Chloroflexota bacterium]
MLDAENGRSRSLLIADCGTSNTRVALLDIVGGGYRLVAHARSMTTTESPWSNVMLGLRAAIKQLETITGRPLLNDRGVLIRPAKENGSGVDRFTAVISAAPPLTTWLVGLSEEISLVSGRRTLLQSYTQKIDSISLADGRSPSDQLTDFVNNPPDIVFVAGGVEESEGEQLLPILERIALGADILTGRKRVRVIYAGNRALRERVRRLVGQSASLQIAENVRPSLDAEALGDATKTLGDLYTDLKIHSLGDVQELQEWGSAGLRLSVNELAHVLHYFANLHQGHVMGLDLGSQYTSIVTAQPKTMRLRIDSELALGKPIINILKKTSPQALSHWLPETISDADVEDFIYNKSLHPHSLPQTEMELLLERAAAREILRCTLDDAAQDWGWGNAPPDLRLLLVRGGIFTNQAHPSQLVLLLLDALQPTGTFALTIDEHGLLPGLGALAQHEPLAVVQTLEAGILNDMGWVVVPTGITPPNGKVLEVTVEAAERELCFEAEISFGNIEVFPIDTDEPTEITLKPSPRIDVGFGVGRSKKITIYGGSVGLIIDARGRPLILPDDDTERQRLLAKWRQDMGGG